MSFAAPLNLLWLIPVLGIVTLLYMLRRPRRDVVVPSTTLWQKMPQEAVQIRRLQKLTPQLLFFVQLAAAALLICAAAQPQIRSAEPRRQSWVVVVDNGVTMQVVDSVDHQTRFAVAQQQASRIVEQAVAANADITLVTTAPPKLVAFTNHGGSDALQAIATLKPSDSETDMPGAALIASAALRGHESAPSVACKALIVSDGAWNPDGDALGVLHPLAFASPALYQIAKTKAETVNIGIGRLSVERDPLQPSNRLQVFAQIAVSGEPQARASLTLREGMRVVSITSVVALENKPALLTFTLNAPLTESGLSASLAPVGRDDQAADNAAYAILPAAGDARVLLIGGSQGVDPGLKRALQLIPGVQIDETRLASLPRSGAPDGYAMYVLDAEGEASERSSMPKLPGNSLVFASNQTGFALSGGSGASSDIVDWDRSHPSLRFADLTGATLKSASAWKSVGLWEPVIESRQGIIAAATDSAEGAARAIQFSFLPRSSGFDRLPAFPIIISNVVAWLTQSSGSESASLCGAPIALAPVKGGWNVARQSSSGKSSRTLGQSLCDENGSPCAESDTNAAGIYTALSSQQSRLFARSADGSIDLAPQNHPLLPSLSIGAPLAVRTAGRTLSATSLLRWAAALCLVALFVEWTVAFRSKAPQRRLV